MKTKLFTLFIVALASGARAWDVSYSVSAVNDSGCTLGVSSIQYSIHSN